MTRPQLRKLQTEAVTDALELIPKEIRDVAKPAVEFAVVRGIEHAMEVFGRNRDQTACAVCQTFLNGIISKLRIED